MASTIVRVASSTTPFGKLSTFLLMLMPLLPVDAGITYICDTSPYNFVNCSFTSVPRAQILAASPTSPITQVQLFHNQISTINNSVDFVDFTSLQNLNMDHNLFTVFPDLGCVGSTLQTLSLTYNAITTVDPSRLAALVALRNLYLSGNRLIFFPDVQLPFLSVLRIDYNLFTALPTLPLIGRSLNSLYANGNFLQSLDTRTLSTYRNLTYFNIVSLSNNLKTFPNFITLPQNSATGITFSIKFNRWLCDCRMRWLRLVYPTFINDNATCASPTSLSGQYITSIPLSKFTCTATTSARSANMNLAYANTYSTNPPAVARYAVPSLTACATSCLATADCSQFNFGTRTDCSSNDANPYYCDVTGSVSSVITLTSAGGANWNVYLFD